MTLKNRGVWLGALLVVWGVVLWAQFGTADALTPAPVSAAPATSPGGPAPPLAPENSTAGPGTPTPAHEFLATEAILKAQRESALLPVTRNPFRPVAGAGATERDAPGETTLILSATVGKFALVNQGRYQVGDELPGGYRLVAIGSGWIDVEDPAGSARRIRLR